MDTPSALPLTPPDAPAKRRFTWQRLVLVVALMAVPLAMSIALWVASTSDAQALGRASVPLAVVLGGSVHLLLRQRGPRTWSWYGLLLVYLYFGLTGVLAEGAQTQELKMAMAETGQALASASDKASSPGHLSASAAAAPGPSPVRQVFQGFVQRTAALKAAYEARMVAAGVPRLLQAEFLRHDRHLTQHQAALDKARHAQVDLAAAQANNLATLKREFEALDLTPLARLRGLHAIDALTSRAMQGLHAETAAELATIANFEQAVALLRSDTTAWQVSGDGLVFQRPDTLAAYNRLLQTIQAGAGAAPRVTDR